MAHSIAEWQDKISEWAALKGWWKAEGSSIPEKIALMHSELSEALEEYRNAMPHFYMAGDKPEGLGVELADCVIRIMHCCAELHIDLEYCIKAKMDYNETRPHRHGGKLA